MHKKWVQMYVLGRGPEEGLGPGVEGKLVFTAYHLVLLKLPTTCRYF